MLFIGASRCNFRLHESDRGQVGHWNRHSWRYHLLSYIKCALAHSDRLGDIACFEMDYTTKHNTFIILLRF